MTYWSLEPNSQFELYLPQEDLYVELNRKGISLSHTRSVFERYYGVFGPTFELIKDGKQSDAMSNIVPDFLLWNWVPIFSVAAKQIIVSLGVGETDFMPCRVRADSDIMCHMYIPAEDCDAVDFNKSKFGFQIPMPSPLDALPNRIELLVHKAGDSVVPHRRVFYARNMHGQSFSELIVQDEVKRAWEASKLSSVRFRLLG